MHIFVEGVLKLNDLRTLNPPSDPSSTGARHNDPARIPLGHTARELATAVVLEGKGMEVGEEGHTASSWRFAKLGCVDSRFIWSGTPYLRPLRPS
jgi:hypothetical protein